MDYSGEFKKLPGPFSTIGRKEQRRCLQNSLLGTKRNRRLLSKTYEESLLIKQHSEKGGIAFTRMYCQENLKVTKILKSTYPQEETAVVYGAECQQGSFALKRFTTGATYAHWKELDLLRQLRSPRILPIYGAFCEGFPHLVTELCYGTLNEYRNRMSDEARLLASMQLMDGVAFLHSAKVVHASLQPQHLLVSRTNDLLISNFVDAIVMNDKDCFSSTYFRGSPAFADLEALTENRYSFKTDFHACACIIFYLESGFHLQHVPDMEQSKENYAAVLQEGYPTTSRAKRDRYVSLEQRLKNSFYRNILGKLLAGTCTAADFLTDEAVLQKKNDFGISSDLKYSDLRQKNFAVQHHGELCSQTTWAFPVPKEPMIYERLNTGFYYDCRDDLMELQRSFVTTTSQCMVPTKIDGLESFLRHHTNQLSSFNPIQVHNNLDFLQTLLLCTPEPVGLESQLPLVQEEVQDGSGQVGSTHRAKNDTMKDSETQSLPQPPKSVVPATSSSQLKTIQTTTPGGTKNKLGQTAVLSAITSGTSGQKTTTSSGARRPRTPPFGFHGAAAYTMTLKNSNVAQFKIPETPDASPTGPNRRIVTPKPLRSPAQRATSLMGYSHPRSTPSGKPYTPGSTSSLTSENPRLKNSMAPTLMMTDFAGSNKLQVESSHEHKVECLFCGKLIAISDQTHDCRRRSAN